ncbi:MBL fold metallo-hydrolase [Arthrobacter sp. B0490]|uniref:MBL fold metallo-hydrolase n=1 Tax=Arthrobacter sp. B0490 TaxID=2058891 RepID=UPI0011B08081|nr:MBL fold metallo-hydrolase [Arthrobacter sp. B0490]
MKNINLIDPVKIEYLYKEDSLEVHCFLVSHENGLILVDAGYAEDDGSGKARSLEQIEAALVRNLANWDDISDVIVTHAHRDHFGVLTEVVAKIPHKSKVWAGSADVQSIKAQSHFEGEIAGLHEGNFVKVLRTISTPGHTAGHICLVHDQASVLFMGDLVDTLKGYLARPPTEFTEDQALAEKSLEKVAQLDFARVLFSHGEEISKPVQALRLFLADSNNQSGEK